MTTRPTASADSSTARLAAPPDALDDDPVVTTVMTPDPMTVAAEARVVTALHLMATAGVRHLPVIERERCVGLVVETDLVRCLAEGSTTWGRPTTRRVGELRRPPRELPPTARASDAARQMAWDASDAVLVTEQGRILGIVTATDLVRMLARSTP